MSGSPEDDDLETTIAFALSQFPHQRQRARRAEERQLYFRAVARAIRRQLQFAWIIAKKPPQQIARSDWKPDADG
jgi:hypothetical protein